MFLSDSGTVRNANVIVLDSPAVVIGGELQALSGLEINRPVADESVGIADVQGMFGWTRTNARIPMAHGVRSRESMRQGVG